LLLLKNTQGVFTMINNINIDPLTGIPNLFGLMESDMASVFQDFGMILYIDLKQLENVNNVYGSIMGDIFIRTVSDSLRSTVYQYFPGSVDISLFRMGGDEFLAVFPQYQGDSLPMLVKELETTIKTKMEQSGLSDADIWSVVWTYSGNMKSIVDLFKECYTRLLTKKTRQQVPKELPPWAEQLIGKLYHRVKETVDLLQHVSSLALKDEITGLPNHRSAELFLADTLTECQEHRRHAASFSVLFIDGDNLKKYNSNGYENGNRMIRELGALISQSLRQDDRVFRWLTGDEFLVLLKDTDKTGAAKLAERLRRHVENTGRDWEYPVTVSIGIASYPEDGPDISVLLKRAEMANLDAKNLGKNRVVQA
jgi:diguanylate cyclase (GGDEF)-like protein